MARSRLRLADVPDHLTVEEFWSLFGNVEHETLEFKGGPNDSFKQLLPAMAMTEGGLAILGVSDTDDVREITGCPLSQRVQDSITRYANQCNVPVQLKAFGVADFELVAVEVPLISDRVVTTPDGRLLRRVGGDSQPLIGDALAAFVRSRPLRSAEEEPLGRQFDAEGFDLERVNAALRRDGRADVAEAELAGALVDLHLAERSTDTSADTSTGGSAGSSAVEVTTAAAILFARDPRQFVPGAAAQLVRRAGTGPVVGVSSDRQECWGPLQLVLECCLEFIGRHSRTYEAVHGLFREPIPEYPDAVVREALLNALAHRDYGLLGTTIDVTVWDDRLEIRSPGPLPGHITVDNMRQQHFSRNRRLMRVLRLMGLVEEFGEGVDRMYRQMETRLMLPPEFTATADSVTVTLRNQFVVDLEEQAWLLALEGWPGSAEERRVLVELRRRSEAAKRHLAEVLPHADLDGVLDRMLSLGLVERVGRAGGTRYRLSAGVIRRAGGANEAEARQHADRLLGELERVGSLSTAEAARLLGVEQTAARKALNELAAAGKVRPAGNTRARRYVVAGGVVADSEQPD